MNKNDLRLLSKAFTMTVFSVLVKAFIHEFIMYSFSAYKYLICLRRGFIRRAAETLPLGFEPVNDGLPHILWCHDSDCGTQGEDIVDDFLPVKLVVGDGEGIDIIIFIVDGLFVI